MVSSFISSSVLYLWADAGLAADHYYTLKVPQQKKTHALVLIYSKFEMDLNYKQIVKFS